MREEERREEEGREEESRRGRRGRRGEESAVLYVQFLQHGHRCAVRYSQ
jgi:hypothetical protein